MIHVPWCLFCFCSRGTADWFGVSKDGDSTQRWRRKSLQHCGQLYGGLKAQVVREMELRSQDNLSLASTETPPPLYLPPLHPSQQHCGIQRVGLPRLASPRPGWRRRREALSPLPDATSHFSHFFGTSSTLPCFFHLFHHFSLANIERYKGISFSQWWAIRCVTDSTRESMFFWRVYIVLHLFCTWRHLLLPVSTTGSWATGDITSSGVNNRGGEHLDSKSPTSPGTWEKLSQWVELKTALTHGSARRSQQTLTLRLGLPSLSGFVPPLV